MTRRSGSTIAPDIVFLMKVCVLSNTSLAWNTYEHKYIKNYNIIKNEWEHSHKHMHTSLVLLKLKKK